MTTACIAMFIFSAAALYFIVRYRVYVHITYTEARPPRRRQSRVPVPATTAYQAPAPPIADATEQVLAQTLVNLGTSHAKARAAAKRAVAAHRDPISFDELIRTAIKEATKAA
jgi:hypothetical protein